MQTPQFLRRLMMSPAYADKSSAEYLTAEKYLQLLYPGVVTADATGRMISPAYDMTLAEFYSAQREFDIQLDAAKQEAAETDSEVSVDENSLDEYVEVAETIDVKVLMPWGAIQDMTLYVYTLNMPDDDGDDNGAADNGAAVKHIWRWHSESGENTCDECASRDGETYESEDDIPEIPVHPNCRCHITAEEIGPDGRTLSSKPYSPKKNAKEIMTKDEKFEEVYNKLKEPEGGYTDGKNQVRDEPTNMGIKQSTLDSYANKHPEKGLPEDVKDLKPEQAKEIYKEVYWTKTNIPDIENERVRGAVFDMNVMGGAGRVVQRTLNDFSDAGLAVDGKIGSKTVNALNSIPESKISDFMEELKKERIEYLQQTENWPTAKGGWTKRTNNY